MFSRLFTSLPNGAATSSAPAARADGAEGNGTAGVNRQLVVESVNAYGFHADPVTTTGVWWVPFTHPGSLAPLSTGVRIEWAL